MSKQFADLKEKATELTLKHFKAYGYDLGQKMCRTLDDYIAEDKAKQNRVI